MIKIIHTADIHLDSPAAETDFSKSDARRNILRAAFTSLMLYSRAEKADIVLLCGDIFDSAYASKDTMSLMMREFEANPTCKFIIAPGNHDPYNGASPYKKLMFPDNVYIFKEPHLTKFSFDDLGCDVYGWAFTSPVMEEHPLASPPTLDPERINILACHCDLSSPVSVYAPVTRAELEQAGFDYAALGHIHLSSGVEKTGAGFYGYSGCLCGRGFDECGKKTFTVCRFEKNGGELFSEFKCVAATKYHFEKESLPVDGAETNVEIMAAAEDLIREKKYDGNTALKLTLTGSTDPSLIVDEAAVRDAFPSLFSLSVADETVPFYDTAYLSQDPTIRGEFYAQIIKRYEDGTPEEKRVAALALKYGLAALDGK